MTKPAQSPATGQRSRSMTGRRLGEPWPRSRRSPMAWWRDHTRVVADTSHFVSARLGTSLLVWLLVGIALALPAGLWLLQVNLALLTADWDGRPGLSVYFEIDAAPSEIDALAKTLAARAEIAEVQLTTRQQALAEFQAFAELADALAMLDENPLPASLRATLELGVQSQDLERAAAAARSNPGVADVVLEKTWLERVNDISQVVSRVGVMLGLLFGIGAVLVTSTSVRLAIESRLEELRVLKLVGATEAQIRRPFLYFGVFYGVGGGLFAAMFLSLCLVIAETPLSNLLGSYGQSLDIASFDPVFLVCLLSIGGVLGVAGALLAARQRLVNLEIL